jgi:hypothetical protein
LEEDKLSEILQAVTYLKTRDEEHARSQHKLDNQWSEMVNMIKENASQIQNFSKISYKIDDLLEQVKKNSEDIYRLTEHKIRSEPIPDRVTKLEAQVESLTKWRWMVLGAAVLIGVLTGLVDATIIDFFKP